jgi:hypothetical protein
VSDELASVLSAVASRQKPESNFRRRLWKAIQPMVRRVVPIQQADSAACTSQPTETDNASLRFPASDSHN